MPRATGTQTRSFVYDDAGRLTSATNPETGTVTYWCNADNTLWKKLDAKGQYTYYGYDPKKRLNGTTTYKPGGAISDQMTYYWDVAPDGSAVAAGQGRMTAMSYTSNGWTTTENFQYAAPGGATSKTVSSSAFSGGLTVSYTLDTYGRTTQVSATGMSNVYYSYGLGTRQTGLAYDCVVPNDCTLVTGAQFDLAGRMTSVQRRTGSVSGTPVYETETRGYNVMGQLTNLNWSGPGGNAGLTYSYSSTMNNGQITGMTDSASGETVSYQYDSLKRLVSATSQKWYQTYSYDGFSNLVSKTTSGSVVNYPVDPTTNRISNGNAGSAGMYDANGNMTGAPGTTLSYDPMNRAITANVNGAVEQYGYDMGNRRLYKKRSDGTLEFTLYGAKGEKLGKYSVVHEWVINDQYPDGTYMDNIYPASQTFWFAGKVIFEGSVSSGVMPSRTDRLGSTSRNYYPYGESKGGAVPLDQVGFATYTRDSFSGLDYAVNRWSLTGMGRFGSADPYVASAGVADPGSWNRYSYVQGEPLNRNDGEGLRYCNVDSSGDCAHQGYDPGGAMIDGIEAPVGLAMALVQSGSSASQTIGAGLAIVFDPSSFGISFGGRNSGPIWTSAGSASTTTSPECPDSMKTFYSHYEIYKGMASDLGTDVNFIVALSARETGYGSSRPYRMQHNLFGASNAKERTLTYSSYEESASKWEARWGKDVGGIMDATTFFQNLVDDRYNVHPGYVNALLGQVADTRRWTDICVPPDWR